MKLNINLKKDTEIRISSHNIKIQIVDDPSFIDHGSWNPATFTIRLNGRDSEEMKLSTLLHELIHAIEEIFLVDIGHTCLNLIAEILAQALIVNYRRDSSE